MVSRLVDKKLVLKLFICVVSTRELLPIRRLPVAVCLVSHHTALMDHGLVVGGMPLVALSIPRVLEIVAVALLLHHALLVLVERV